MVVHDKRGDERGQCSNGAAEEENAEDLDRVPETCCPDGLGSSASGAGAGDSSTTGSAGTDRRGEVSVGADIVFVGVNLTGRLQMKVRGVMRQSH